MKYKDLLLGSIFFDTKNFPIALVDTNKFTYQNEQELNLEVELSIKGTTQKVPLQIEVHHLADEIVQVKTKLIFSRTAFGIGTGQWSSTAVLKDRATIQTNLFLFKE
jgi:polyisoprenoid-binding protein YceI